ncbi:hypothetical protein BDN72DRAFT_840462 [Pluteus cervinus]|uniref:Uncharacterized protein n=1 Tax=Pluteus cervinus TaxID=181527 RepID=A0ACD3AUS2_9AGAR|nr:hypothetical protein BDN72DRAFT_840462 [Pluteus cervinus]
MVYHARWRYKTVIYGFPTHSPRTLSQLHLHHRSLDSTRGVSSELPIPEYLEKKSPRAPSDSTLEK